MTELSLIPIPYPSTRRCRFPDELAAARPGIVVISGDIAEQPTLADMLGLFAEAVAAPVLFVLGNHDAYRGTVAGAKRVRPRGDGAAPQSRVPRRRRHLAALTRHGRVDGGYWLRHARG